MIQKAVLADCARLYAITKSCAEQLINEGIFQWDEKYPSLEILKRDIELKQVWKIEENSKIVGLVVLTEIEDDAYKNVQWQTKTDRNLYVHRLAVHPNFQGKGFAQKLMDFAENYAKENNYISIRLDTFSKNKRNQRFYEQRNYQRLESIYLLNQSEFPFYCYELILNA